MPLSTGTTKAAREQNIATEIKAGKRPEQAVAIAYSQQRRNVARKAGNATDTGPEVTVVTVVLSELASCLSTIARCLEAKKK